MVRVSGLGIYVFSVCKGKFGEVERLTVVVVGVGRRGRCPPGGGDGVGDGSVHFSGRRWML